jgi:hypothetical protein
MPTLVVIINSHEATGEGHYFAECDEKGFMDLSLGVDEDTAEEEYKPAYREGGCCEELNV